MDWGQKLKGSPAGGQQSLLLVVPFYFPGHSGKEKFPRQKVNFGGLWGKSCWGLSFLFVVAKIRFLILLLLLLVVVFFKIVWIFV